MGRAGGPDLTLRPWGAAGGFPKGKSVHTYSLAGLLQPGWRMHGGALSGSGETGQRTPTVIWVREGGALRFTLRGKDGLREREGVPLTRDFTRSSVVKN